MLLIKNSYEWWFLVDFLLPPQELFYYIINDNLQQELCLIYEHIITCSSETLKCNHYAFNSSSILIAGNGEFNVKHFSGKFNAYQRTYVLTPKQEHYGLLYLACLYQIKSFKSSSAGSIVKFITKGDIDNIPVFIPDDGNYLIQMNKLLDLQEMRLRENEKLLALRDFLLPLLMNGQATIAE